MNKSILTLILSSLFVVLLASCGSKYNRIKFPDPNETNKDVYGNKGGDPITVAEPTKPDPAVGEISKPNAGKFREQIEASIQK